MPEILIISLLGAFVLILEGISLLFRFIFCRERFMSWWNNKPVECDEYTAYCPTYNRRGFIRKMTLNPKWLRRKIKEGTLGYRDKNHKPY